MQATTDIPPSLLLWSAGTLNILVLAGVGIIYRTLRDHGDRLLTMSVVLTGDKGDNGIKSEVTALKRAKHRIDNNINALGVALATTRYESHLDPMDLRLRAEGE